MTDYILDSRLSQMRGVIGRYPGGNDRYIFEYERVALRGIHMVGVRRPLRVTWLVEGEINESKLLKPWVGWGLHRGDTIIEERPES